MLPAQAVSDGQRTNKTIAITILKKGTYDRYDTILLQEDYQYVLYIVNRTKYCYDKKIGKIYTLVGFLSVP